MKNNILYMKIEKTGKRIIPCIVAGGDIRNN